MKIPLTSFIESAHRQMIYGTRLIMIALFYRPVSNGVKQRYRSKSLYGEQQSPQTTEASYDLLRWLSLPPVLQNYIGQSVHPPPIQIWTDGMEKFAQPINNRGDK